MIFIDRDESGKIVMAARCAQHDGQESLPEDHPDIVAFYDRPVREPIDAGEVLDALAEFASGGTRKKLDSLLAKRDA